MRASWTCAIAAIIIIIIIVFDAVGSRCGK
jgi:hypothetical protein